MEQADKGFHGFFRAKIAALLSSRGPRRPPGILDFVESLVLSPTHQHRHIAAIPFDHQRFGHGRVEILAEAILHISKR
jgi:hypothetical protein